MADDKPQALPAPFLPAQIDLRDFQFMPLFGDRLFQSETWILATDAERVAALRLWWRAWHEVPAGSLPADDRLLSNLAGYGVAVRAWRKVKTGALRGFRPCADGRLWHPFIAEQAAGAWNRKSDERWRKECERRRKENRKRTDDGREALPMPAQPEPVAMVVPAESPRIPAERDGVSGGHSGGKARNGAGIPAEIALKGQGHNNTPPIPPSPAVPTEQAGPSPDDIRQVRVRVWQQEGKPPDWIEGRLASASAEGRRNAIAWLRMMPVGDVLALIDRAYQDAEGRRKPIARPWAYLDAVMQGEVDRKADRDVKDDAGNLHPDRLVSTWRARLRSRGNSDFWPESWGPPPGEDGCEVPTAILAAVGLAPA